MSSRGLSPIEDEQPHLMSKDGIGAMPQAAMRDPYRCSNERLAGPSPVIAPCVPRLDGAERLHRLVDQGSQESPPSQLAFKTIDDSADRVDTAVLHARSAASPRARHLERMAVAADLLHPRA